MANWNRKTTITAAEDLSDSQYKAVAVVDGKVANNAEEATGILHGKTNSGDHAAASYIGEIRYAAGGAITKGDKLTVATSGWFTTADSNDTIVGEAKETVTSGSNGAGLFAFPAASGKVDGIQFAVTAADGIGAAFAYTMQDNKLANNGPEFSGLAPSAIASGDAGQIIVSGLATATYADSYGAGTNLIATTSGYMTALSSGDTGNVRTLTAADSGSTGTVVIGCGQFLTA
jgi:hypothetical protein